jgi:hypothetical protein
MSKKPNVNVVFQGPVGQVVEGGDLSRVDTAISMNPDGSMTVSTVITTPSETE